MIRTISVFAVSVAAFTSTAAVAQDFSGAVTLGYSHTKQSELDATLNGLTLDGRLAFNMGNGVTFGVRYDAFNLNTANQPIDINGNFVGLNVNYDVSDAFSAKVFLEDAAIGAKLGPASLTDIASIKSFGIEGHYKTGGMDFGAFYAQNKLGGAAGLIAAMGDLDVSSFGLSAKYDAADNFVVGGSFMRTHIDVGAVPGADADIDYIGIAAAYGINDQFSVFGGLSQTKQSEAELKVNTIALGGSYDLTDRAGFPLIASLELARTTLKQPTMPISPDVDSIRLGLTMPLGKGSVKAPLNSTADSILNPSHDVISQTFLNF